MFPIKCFMFYTFNPSLIHIILELLYFPFLRNFLNSVTCDYKVSVEDGVK